MASYPAARVGELVAAAKGAAAAEGPRIMWLTLGGLFLAGTGIGAI
jgi:hypothetical protein